MARCLFAAFPKNACIVNCARAHNGADVTRTVDSNLKTINIVIPVFNESGNMEKLVEALDAVGREEPA